MPDTSVKVYHGEFPDRDVTDRMKIGEKLLWIPDDRMRKIGCTPCLYILERFTARGVRNRTILMPYTPVLPHFGPNG